MAHQGWSRSLYLRERGHSTRNRLQTLWTQLRNSPNRSEGLGTQNRKCAARPGPPGPPLLAQGLQAPDCPPRASGPPAARPGPPGRRLLAPGLWAPGCSPRVSRSGAARPRIPGRALLAPGLQAGGCSPRASRPGAARYGSLWLKPFLFLREGVTQTQTPARLRVPCSETPDRKSTRLNSSHLRRSRMPSSA